MLRPQLPSKDLAQGRGFSSPRPKGIPLTGHADQLLLQLLDPRRQRGDLLPGRDRLDLRIGTTKAEVLHLCASCRQELVGIGKKAFLPLKLVPDVPLPLEKDRLPKGPGLELLGEIE